jgi:hypothetical protein
MVTEHGLDQHERRRVLAQDASLRDDKRLREQGTTLHQFSQEETLPRGRFTEVSHPKIVGQSENAGAIYPAASSPWQGPDLVGDEPPLPPHENEAFEVGPAGSQSVQGQHGEPAAPLPYVERGSPPIDDPTQGFIFPLTSTQPRDVGSSRSGDPLATGSPGRTPVVASAEGSSTYRRA